jgi:hypothetical protein
VERFLSYLVSIENSPNTVKAYAHDLKDWFTYLAGHGLEWRRATLEDVAGFVAWLRLPPEARAGKVAMLPTVEHYCSASSVNRKLAALTSFCEFHARHGVALAGLLVTMQPAGRRGSAASYKPFLHHISKNAPQRHRTIKLKTSRSRPKVLTAEQAQTILDACDHLRDRLLFALLLDCGVRIGEALGLRHEDLEIADRSAVGVAEQLSGAWGVAVLGVLLEVRHEGRRHRLPADSLALLAQEDQAQDRVEILWAQGECATSAAGGLGVQPQQQAVQCRVVASAGGSVVNLAQPSVGHRAPGGRQAAGFGDLAGRVGGRVDQSVVFGVPVEAAQTATRCSPALRPPRALRRATTVAFTCSTSCLICEGVGSSRRR